MDNVWKIIKDLRRNFLTGNRSKECETEDNQISKKERKSNIDHVQEKLKTTQIQENVLENVKREILQLGVEMYTYLNFCTPKIIKFYKELLLQGSTKDIILALTNIMKTKRNAEESTAKKIWKKLKEEFKFTSKNSKKIRSLTWTEIQNCTKNCSEDLKNIGLLA